MVNTMGAQRIKPLATAVVFSLCFCAICACSDTGAANDSPQTTEGVWGSTSEFALVTYSAVATCRSDDPWFADFGAKLIAAWVPPPAYNLGLLMGSTHVRVEVAEDGTKLAVAVIDSFGHVSLHAASRAALANMEAAVDLASCVGTLPLVLDLEFDYGPLDN